MPVGLLLGRISVALPRLGSGDVVLLGNLIDRIQLAFPLGVSVGPRAESVNPGSSEICLDSLVAVVAKGDCMYSAADAVSRFYHSHIESSGSFQHLGSGESCHAGAYDGDFQSGSTLDIVVRVGADTSSASNESVGRL